MRGKYRFLADVAFARGTLTLSVGRRAFLETRSDFGYFIGGLNSGTAFPFAPHRMVEGRLRTDSELSEILRGFFQQSAPNRVRPLTDGTCHQWRRNDAAAVGVWAIGSEQ